MTKERRQFLTVDSVGGAGLPRELLVDGSTGRVYCATSSQPAGVGQALQSEVANLQSQIDSLKSGHWSHVIITRVVDDWIDVATAPDSIEGISIWPWTPESTARQYLLDAGYNKMTLVSFSFIADNQVLSFNEIKKLRVMVEPSKAHVLDDDFMIASGIPSVILRGGHYMAVFSVFSKTGVYGRIDFLVSYVEDLLTSVPNYTQPQANITRYLDGDITYQGWRLVNENNQWWWKCDIDRITIARCTNGLVLSSAQFRVSGGVADRDSSAGVFNCWFVGSGTSELSFEGTYKLPASEGDTKPPLGFSARIICTFNVN